MTLYAQWSILTTVKVGGVELTSSGPGDAVYATTDASGAEAPDGGNYNDIVYVPGTLTISTKSSSSNGGGGGSSTLSYSVTNGTAKAENGSVTLSNVNATSGTTVKITPKADDGYEVDTLTVKDASGKVIAVTKNADGTYSFKMPSSKVTVTATFKAEGKTQLPFTDVAEDNWARDSIALVYEKGLFNGTTGSTFGPAASMTRQQMWMVLARMAGQTPATMADAAAWATETGMSDGTNPGAAVTRQQFVTLLWRAAGSPASTYDLSRFHDAAGVAEYGKTAMAWAVEQGILSGSNGYLLSADKASRAQIAVIPSRYLSK